MYSEIFQTMHGVTNQSKEVKKLDDTESVHNDIIIIKNLFFINNQLFVNCYKIWHMYRFIIINNKIFIYNLHLLLWFSYIQGVMSAGGYVRRGFCPQGVLFRGLFISL